MDDQSKKAPPLSAAVLEAGGEVLRSVSQDFWESLSQEALNALLTQIYDAMHGVRASEYAARVGRLPPLFPLEPGEISAAEIVRRLCVGSDYPDGLTGTDVLAHVDWRTLSAADWEDGYTRSETCSRVHAEAVEKARAVQAR